ncbi:Arginase/deacetylase [Ascodesmis nigricans]|uniref:Arginase/deacetylase n=1 Tax=Ascodesmis nigricans TaxID=341454 RepID=A0A4S2MMW1_9PEZI|nr:Arginase/deacetylase [Ascodesmis nigricans]
MPLQRSPSTIPPDRSIPPSSSSPSTSDLSRSLSRLSLRASPRSGPNTLSRRASLQFDHIALTTPNSPISGDTTHRGLSRTPSTPNIRKRASMSSLPSSTPTASSTLRRKSSMMSIRHSPPESVAEEPPEKQRLEPPPQDPYAVVTVILQDDCYGHRYSRPRTSAKELESIVERPERIAAAVLGVSVLQVKAGRGAVRVVKSERREALTIPEVGLVHAHSVGKGKTWPDELGALCDAATEKLKRGEVEIPKTYHAGDLYLSKGSRRALEGSIGAIFDGVDLVMGGEGEGGRRRRAFVCIRPPGHHCGESTPSGFCFLNNIHLAIAHAARHYGLTHAVILDFDLHHGDGSQAITWSLNDLATRRPSSSKSKSKRTGPSFQIPTIGYFSMHDINSFPCESGVAETIRNASINLEGAHNQWIRNIHLTPYTTNDEFWDLYNSRYSGLITSARRFLLHHQKLTSTQHRAFKPAIFLSAGFDASEHETPGMQRHAVNIPTDFFARFTADAVDLSESLCSGRILSILEGGYSDRAITSGVLSHLAGLSCTPPDRARFIPPSLTVTPGSRNSYHSYHSTASPSPTDPSALPYDPQWWSQEALDTLFRHVVKMTPGASNPPSSPTGDKNFMSATAASSAKIALHPRRVSSRIELQEKVKVVTPWEVAAWELRERWVPVFEGSKPIPAVEKVKKTGTRHSIAVPPSTMTLRARKPVVVAGAEEGRRKTLGPEAMASATAKVSRAPSRASKLPPSVSPVAKGKQTAATTTPTKKETVLAQTRTSARRTSTHPHSPPPTGSVTSPSHPSSPVVVVNRKPGASESDSQALDTLANGIQRIKLTYKNADRDRERECELAHRHSTHHDHTNQNHNQNPNQKHTEQIPHTEHIDPEAELNRIRKSALGGELGGDIGIDTTMTADTADTATAQILALEREKALLELSLAEARRRITSQPLVAQPPVQIPAQDTVTPASVTAPKPQSPQSIAAEMNPGDGAQMQTLTHRKPSGGSGIKALAERFQLASFGERGRGGDQTWHGKGAGEIKFSNSSPVASGGHGANGGNGEKGPGEENRK